MALVISALGFAVANAVLDDLTISGLGPLLLLALALALVGMVLRPLLVALATMLGWPGAVLLALFGQVVIVYVAVLIVPNVEATFWGAFWAGWIVAAVVTLVGWVTTAGTGDALLAHLVRRARRATPVSDPELTGVVFVQLDGVPFPVLEWGVLAGTLPTLSKWVRSGRYRMREWTPMLPATTPASQMGILHGTIEGIPAFRWVDRPSGRVFVANKPKDAADIEALHSDGRGLLVDGGVSVSNLFSGDAPVAYATMSSLGRAVKDTSGRRAFNDFVVRPQGLARGVVRTVSELGREWFQARRQIRQDMRPRVHRGLGFAGERAALNGVLRDFNTLTVADAMLNGARSIYVDYVDYDAVAHHAGIMRPESLDALVGLDSVLAQLEQVAALAPRPYRIVVLSDHGQSQGEVFADRFGEELGDVVARLAKRDVAGGETNTEGAARVGAMSDDAPPVISRALQAGSAGSQGQAEKEIATAQAALTDATPSDEDAPLLVFGSGNLGLVYVAGEQHRLTLEELDQRFPDLVSGLVAHEGVSFAVVDSAEGLLVLGKHGRHRLRDGLVTGVDPLAPFGPNAPAFVLRASSMPESPDIAVNSLLDQETGEVAAFEGLVGCHGGLGGWQDRAMLIWPVDLPAPPDRLVGADAVHRLLVSWLEHFGQRSEVPSTPTRVTEGSTDSDDRG
ncbi:MAG: phage holin family protein [Ornithinibacter sp.]